VSETLNTADTIRGWVSQIKNPPPLEREDEKGNGEEEGMGTIEEVRMILDLGSGVNGHKDICHGGFVAVILDEVTGFLLVANEVRDRALSVSGSAENEEIIKRRRSGREKFKGPVMTASLAIRYERPVVTPGIVVARAVMDRVEGRKRFVRGTVEDLEGGVYARGEGVFVQLKEKL
jgi:acyl-coenzyme A thioesterase PaaI-like protein